MQITASVASYSFTPDGLAFRAKMCALGTPFCWATSHPGVKEHSFRVLDWPVYLSVKRFCWNENPGGDFFPFEQRVTAAVEAVVLGVQLGTRLATHTHYRLLSDAPGVFRALAQPYSRASCAWIRRHYPSAEIIDPASVVLPKLLQRAS